MKTILQAAAVVLLFTFYQCCFGIENTNIVAIGDWSEPVDSLCGRLSIIEGYSPGYAGKTPETLVYLELKNVSTNSPSEVYFDPKQGLQCELRNAQGQPPPPTGMGGDGGFPSTQWITVPPDSSVQLRASWYGYGMQKNEGLKIPLFNVLVIRADDTNDYFLSGTFTVGSLTNNLPSEKHIWTGMLKLPKMKITGKRP